MVKPIDLFDFDENFPQVAGRCRFDDFSIREVAAIVLKTATEHGFVADECDIDQKLLLTVGELIEAQNELRDGHAVDEVYYTAEKPDKPEGFVIEIADGIIRLLDLAEELRQQFPQMLDIQSAIELKATYNDTRPYKHGKKF